MKPIYVLLFALITRLTEVYSQNLSNFGFENIDKKTGHPVGMQLIPADQLDKYFLRVDSTVKTQGAYSFSIASDPTKSGHTFLASSFVVPGNYSGQKVQLKGFLKTENVGGDSGFAGLWMRVDGENGPLAFDNMASRKITGTNDWKEYTIELPLSNEAEKITVGAILSRATGKIWFDQLSLFIDGVEIEKAAPRPAIVYKAKLDTSFGKDSRVSFPPSSSRLVVDFQLLGQVWGFLKYYHPFVAKGNIQWDNELFRFLPTYIKASNSKARDQVLLEWINQLGPLTPCSTCDTEVKEFSRLKPDLAWMEKLKATKLYEPLQQILKNRNQGSHYYISLGSAVNPIFKNEKAYSIDHPDAGVRLLTLYRYWNMIQYFYPYKDIIGEDWNTVLSEFIPKFIEAKDKLAYRLVVLELISRINDSHASLVEDSVLRKYKGNRIAPVQVKFIDNKLVVTDYYHPLWGPKSGLKPGDIITSIQGKPIEKIAKEKLKYTSASNYPIKQRNMAREMLRSNATQLQLEIKREDAKSSTSVQLFPLDSIKTDIDRAYRKPDSCYRFLSKDVGYIYLGNIKASLLPRIFKTFANTKGIVIDIRNYPSESVVFSMSEYLLGEEKEFVKFNAGSIDYPGFFRWMGRPKIGSKKDNNYKGKIVILVNDITQSHAEYTAMALRTADNAIMIGSTTAAADGNVSSILLPGNLTTRITGIGVFYPDGRETQRVGILLDEVVKPSIKGIKEGLDELLERAISIINQTK